MFDDSPAQTNLQLFAQLHRNRYNRADIETVRDAYMLAADIFAGQYRGSGKTFLAHLIGTASVLVREHAPVAFVCAGLLHSAYASGEFGILLRRNMQPKRDRVRAAAGDATEQLVDAYTALDWKIGVVERFLESIDRGDTTGVGVGVDVGAGIGVDVGDGRDCAGDGRDGAALGGVTGDASGNATAAWKSSDGHGAFTWQWSDAAGDGDVSALHRGIIALRLANEIDEHADDGNLHRPDHAYQRENTVASVGLWRRAAFALGLKTMAQSFAEIENSYACTSAAGASNPHEISPPVSSLRSEIPADANSTVAPAPLISAPTHEAFTIAPRSHRLRSGFAFQRKLDRLRKQIKA